MYSGKTRLLVGKGDRMGFWSDLWLGERPLKEICPRLYMISRNKSTLVKDCYKMEGNEISWNLDFRWELHSFEIGSRVDLLTQLQEFVVIRG